MSKKPTKKRPDPFAKRESEKYTNPIASREFILTHIENRGSPAALKDLSAELEIQEDQYEALSRRVKAMLRDGQLEKLKGHRFWPSDRRILIKGLVRIEKGKYKVIPDDGGARIDIINFNQQPVYSGVKVIVSIPEIPNEILRQGKIVEVLEEKQKVITGRFIKDLGFNYVIPHSREFVYDILVPEGKSREAVDGDIVVIRLITSESKWTEPVGEIIEVLGNENVKGIEIKAALKGFDIPYDWPEKVVSSLNKLKETVPPQARKGRVDLRELPLVTIDGEDAKDYDDAVFSEVKKTGGWRLYVAIADVSHYVKPSGVLDKEAVKRGNSVYFPGQVVPMLPEILSNGLCSLKPNVDRLAMVCEMTISEEGLVSRYKFYEAIIHSKARLTYTKVFKLLNSQSANLADKYKDLLPHLQVLNNVYEALRIQRESRGAIDFETVETKIIFNKSGKIKRIEPVHRNIAHKIIEECMLAANVSTAKFLKKSKIPGIYRIHEPPVNEKFLDLQTFLFEIGVKYKFGKDPSPLDYGKILRKIRDRPDADIIQMVLLRSLSQAVYSPDNVGHFGLAYAAYTHFTSPIRRYPDLLVHRQIKAVITGEWSTKAKDNQEKSLKMLENLNELSQHCSITERRADDATRDVVRWLKCQYMETHLGKTFRGIISTVTRFGFFVELNEIYVDGLVHVSNLRDDYYIFDGIHHKLTGEVTGREYKIGVPVEVTVAKVDLDDRKIDFSLNSAQADITKKVKSKSKSKPKTKYKPGKKPKPKAKHKVRPKVKTNHDSKHKSKFKPKSKLKKKTSKYGSRRKSEQ